VSLTHRLPIPIPPLARALALAGLCACGSSNSTGPSKTSGISGTYVGALASPVATGAFVAAFGSAASDADDRRLAARGLATPARSHVEGGTSGSITITLLDGTTLTLTGSSNGTTFTVSDNLGDSCTGTAANALNATCTLAIAGGVTLPLVGVLGTPEVASALTTYCGLDTSLLSQHVAGSILLGIGGGQSFIVNIAAGTDSESFFTGTASNGTLALTPVTSGNGNSFSGTYTSTTATGVIAGPGTSGVVANWGASSPCALVSDAVSPAALTFTAAAGTAPPAQTVVISPAAAGPATALVAANTTWLSATASGDSVTFSVASNLAAGTYDGTAQVYAQFAKGPLTVTVRYVVSGGGSGQGFAGLFLASSDGQVKAWPIDSLTTSNSTPTISGGTGAASGAGFLAADAAGDLWISSGFRNAIFLIPTSQFSSSGLGWKTVCALPTPSGGNAPQPVGVAVDRNGTVWVADSANAGWFYGYSTAGVAQNCSVSPSGASTPTYTYHLTSVNNSTTPSLTGAEFAGIAFDAAGNLWLLDQAQGFAYKILAGQLTGSNLALSADLALNVVSEGGDQSPFSIAFDASGNLWVSYLGHGSIEEYAAPPDSASGASYPMPANLLLTTGVKDSITSIAFDGSGNLWLVEGARVNSEMAFVPASQLSAQNGTLTPTVTFAENDGGVQGPKVVAFTPAPAGLPLAAHVPGAPVATSRAHAASRLRGGVRR